MSGSARPLIVVTNDDGIHADGIKPLAAAAQELGDVFVIAPDRNCSGVSHTISLHKPLRCTMLEENWWQVEGSPADCVYLALNQLLEDRPALVLSGVNAGPNMSYDVHYSGTTSAAIEGTLLGIPSIAVSLVDPINGSFDLAARFAAKLGKWVLGNKIPGWTTLNVNVPGGEPNQYQMTFLGHRMFKHSVHKRNDPRGSPYYWIGGVPAEPRDLPGSDCNAVADGIISVTPLNVDVTDRAAFTKHLKGLKVEGIEKCEQIEPPSLEEREPFE